MDRSTDGLMEAAGVETIRLVAGWPATFKYQRGSWPRVRGALAEVAWPDRWAGFGLRAGRWLVRNADRFDLVISSAFPWSDLLPGLALAGTARGRTSWTTAIRGRSQTSAGVGGEPLSIALSEGSFRFAAESSSRRSQPASCSPATSGLRSRPGAYPPGGGRTCPPTQPSSRLPLTIPARWGCLRPSPLSGSVSGSVRELAAALRSRRSSCLVRSHRRPRHACSGAPPRGRISSVRWPGRVRRPGGRFPCSAGTRQLWWSADPGQGLASARSKPSSTHRCRG